MEICESVSPSVLDAHLQDGDLNLSVEIVRATIRDRGL
jgi:hypothetical protein